MEVDNRGKEEVGEQFNGSAISCRDHTPGAAAEFGAHACLTAICSFLAKQITRGVPNNPMEARPADGMSEHKVMGREGQKSYLCEYHAKDCRGRGEQSRVDHPGNLEAALGCRNSFSGKYVK